MLKSLEKKVEILEGEAKAFAKKLIRLSYNMEDYKVIIVQVQTCLNVIKSKSKELREKLKSFKM